MKQSALIWCVIQDSDLLIENWGDDFIVYHCMSGETHQMDVFSISVLELLINGQRTEQQLIRDICKLYSLENNARTLDSLTQVINTFDQIGLIEPYYL